METKQVIPFLPSPDPKELQEKLKGFNMYCFILYSSQDQFGEWISGTNRGSWLSTISSTKCLVRVFENPSKWGKIWHNALRDILGEKDFEDCMEKWKEMDTSYRDMSYAIAEQLGIDSEVLPCLLFIDELDSKNYLTLPIIENQEEVKKYLEDVFKSVRKVIIERPNNLEALNEEFKEELKLRWLWPEKFTQRTATLQRWLNVISPLAINIIGIITAIFFAKEPSS